MKILSYFAFSNFILLLICIVYGFEYVKKSKLAISYIMMFLSFAIWCLGSAFFYVESDQSGAVFWYAFSSLGWITFPAFTLNFFILLSGYFENKAKKRKVRTIFLIYLVPCVFLIKEFILNKNILYNEMIKSSLGDWWVPVNTVDNIWSWMYVIYLILCFVYGFYIIRKWGSMSVYYSEKKHSVIILFATFITFMLGFSTDILGHFIWDVLPPLSAIFLIIIIIETFFVIRRYRLFDDPSQIKSKKILDSIYDPVIFFDSEYKVAKINKAVTDVFGYTFEELNKRQLVDIIEGHKYNEQNISILQKNKHIRNKEINILTVDGRIINTIYSASVVENEYKEFLGYIITFKDITEIKMIENKIIESNENYKEILEDLFYTANCDQLTGLFNRSSFYRKLKELKYYYRKYKYDFAIIFADLNGFKLVNDEYGHDMGDAVLVEASIRLKKCMGENDLVYRIGGDEFVIILQKLPIIEDPQDSDIMIHPVINKATGSIIIDKINEIKNSFSKDMIIDGIKSKISHSIGIALGYAVFSKSGEDIDTMIKIADAKMYEDKADGRKFVFDPVGKEN